MSIIVMSESAIAGCDENDPISGVMSIHLFQFVHVVSARDLAPVRNSRMSIMACSL